MISNMVSAAINVFIGIAFGAVVAVFALEAVYEFSYQRKQQKKSCTKRK